MHFHSIRQKFVHQEQIRLQLGHMKDIFDANIFCFFLSSSPQQ